MLLALAKTVSAPSLVASLFAIAALCGAAFAIFRANAAQGLIALMKENIEQLETSRDLAEDRANAAEREQTRCSERCVQLESRIKVLERLVTGTDAINALEATMTGYYQGLQATLTSIATKLDGGRE